MPLYGLDVIKSSAVLPQFRNRYHVFAASLAAAQVIAGSVVDAENIIYGAGVTTTRTHVWVPNAEPPVFSNQTRTDVGAYTATNPLPPFIVVEVEFGTESSYVGRKYHRVQVDSSALTGDHYSAGYLSALSDFGEAMSEVLGLLRAPDGGEYTSVAVKSKYNHMQLHKAWYNRATPPPA